MGWFSGKLASDPGRYTFQQVLGRLATALEQAEANKSAASDDVQLEITVRGRNMVETIIVPSEGLREVAAILKLNAEQDEAK